MKAHRGKLRSVGLWGHNGTGNLGNEATISAVIQNLRKWQPNILLYGFSWNPQDTRERHGIASFPINRRAPESRPTAPSAGSMQAWYANWKTRLKRYPMVYNRLRWILTPLLELRFLFQAHRSLKGIDLMLVAGTGLVADSFDGAKGYPYSLFKWSLFCRIRGVKWAVVSAGAGPIDASMSKRLIKKALSRTVYRSFRDAHSKRLIEKLGVRGENHVFPDLVFSLNLSGGGVTFPQERPKTVAINALPYRKPGSWENPSRPDYQHYLDFFAKFTSCLFEEGYAVSLVPTQVGMDPVFIEDLQERILAIYPRRSRFPLLVQPTTSFEQVISQFSEASIVVTTRLHGVIFSYLLGKPVLALSYHPKISELMKDFGQDRFCFDIHALDVDLLVKRLKELESVKDTVSRRIQEKVELNKRLLEEQYLELLQL